MLRGGAALSYDPAGRLGALNVGGLETRFVYDGGQLAAETNGANAILRRILRARTLTPKPVPTFGGCAGVPGPGVDETLAVLDAASVTYALNDQRNTPSAWADGAGTLYAQFYGAFGEEGPANLGRIGFTGQMRIPELGLDYYKARFYDPRIGRFLTPDPAGMIDGPNLYAYVLNDPINSIDPSGLDVFVIARPVAVPGNFHTAIFVADCLGCPPKGQFSAGPDSPYFGARLVDQTRFGNEDTIGGRDREAF